MEDKKTLTPKRQRFFSELSKKITRYSRLAIGKNINGEAERIEAKKLRRILLAFAAYFSLGFLFARPMLPFGARPLAIALVSSLGGINAPFAYLGAILGAFFSDYILVYTLTPTLALFLRILIKRASIGRNYFKETLSVRMAVAAVSAFLAGFAEAAWEGFGKRSVTALAIAVVAAVLLAKLFAEATEKSSESILKEPSKCVILFFVIYSLDTVGILGFSLGMLAGYFFTLYVAITSGALRGTLVGLVTGLAISVSNAPVLAAAGLCAGLGAVINIGYAFFAAFGLSSVMSAYINGFNSLLFFIGEAFLATLLLAPLAKTGKLPQIKLFADEGAEAVGIKYAVEERKNFRRKKLEALSNAFDELSDVFLELSEKQKRPSGYEIREMSDEVLSKYCKKCALSNLCWQKNYTETNLALSSLVKKLKSGEAAVKDDLPEAFGERCCHIERILRDINNSAADLVERAVKRDKTELFALDYEAMAELLESAAAEDDNEFEADKPLAKEAAKALRSLGISALGYSAWGTRKKTLVASGIEIGTLSASGREIKEALEERTGLSLGEPKFDFNGDFVTMCVESKPTISTEIFCTGITKENEQVSGDVLAVFEGRGASRYALICDGMGSGRAAAITARISTVFLEKMLSAGNKKGIVLKMLSNFLRSKSEECHCTADLLEIDLLTSSASFTKCGASPSFVMHGDNIFKIDARTVPVGITREINAEEITTPLSAGDIIVMVSDGVAPSLDDAPWLSGLLVESQACDCREIAKRITERASSERGEPDDMSIIVIKITEA